MSLSNCFRDLARKGSQLTFLTMAMALSPPVAAGPDAVFVGLGNALGPTLFPDGAQRYSRALGDEGLYRIKADFLSLGGDPLSVSFMIDKAASRASMRGFGISDLEIEALTQACMSTRNCNQLEFDRRLANYFRQHKLRMKIVPGKSPRLFVDIPEVVRHNHRHVLPVAAALQQLGSERGGNAEWIFEAALALVQGGLEYRSPSPLEAGRQTLGFYTPPRALEKGYGDCDTKSALLAAILRNLGESEIIGVRVPNHYLLGIARVPREGEAYLNYQGRPYVLLEAAGPAQRRPGDIADKTRTALRSGAEIRIDPMLF